MDPLHERVYLVLSDEEDDSPLIFRDMALALDTARSLTSFGANTEVYECLLIKTYSIEQKEEVQ